MGITIIWTCTGGGVSARGGANIGGERLEVLVFLDLREGAPGQHLHPFALMDGVPLAIVALHQEIVGGYARDRQLWRKSSLYRKGRLS